jgi:cell fate regulator YaaT (PSP1 superfamily)
MILSDSAWASFTEPWDLDEADRSPLPHYSPSVSDEHLTANPRHYRVTFHARRTQICISVIPEMLNPDEYVITNSDRGYDLGKIEAAVPGPVSDKEVKRIIRKATPIEIASLAAKAEREIEAVSVCQAIVRNEKCPMRVTDAQFQFDGSQVTFYYTADEYIDFRGLVKVLFRKFGIRIWMIWYDGQAPIRDVFTKKHRRQSGKAGAMRKR